MFLFRDRVDAGQQLAAALSDHARREDAVVLGLPRGGVVVGYEVARALQVPLDVIVVRKLGVPGQEELAMGAIASGGVRILNQELLRLLEIPERVLEAVTAVERAELERRERLYRNGRLPVELAGRLAVLVDDGLATGASMRAAVASVKACRPAELVVAVPVAAPESCVELQPMVESLVCLATPRAFFGVGQWYQDFSQTTDEEVRGLLQAATDLLPRPAS